MHIFQSIRERERIGQVSEFNLQDSLDGEIVENENEENTAPPASSEIQDVEESGEKPIAKAKGKKEKKREKFNQESSNKNDDELLEDYLDKQIPRNKKAMKTKLEDVLIELHGKNEILSKSKPILDRLTNERVRHFERIEEKEKVIERKELIIQSFHEERQVFTQRIEEKESELREKERLLRKANVNVELLADRLKSEEKRRQAYRGQLEIRLTEKEQALRQASDERAELRDQLRRKETFLLEKDRTLHRLEKQLQYERRTQREQEAALQERLRNMQIQMDQERNRRISIERELTEERLTLQQDRENLERERERYEQRIRDSERNAIESEHRLRELQSAVSSARDTLAEYRRLEPRDWIIRRDEVTLSENSLGVGAWGKVYEGSFRGCKVAVKQIHELILSPHNRRLFEREMSIASRCRHPHLLQFIGATNDDGSPLFVTELLDTDLRNILTQRALHQEEIICLALDVSRGLNYLHLNKPFPIMHRDISSSNVLLWRRDNSWRAKLSDYGAANFMRQYMTENPGARIYAAPEALTSQQSPKVRRNLVLSASECEKIRNEGRRWGRK